MTTTRKPAVARIVKADPLQEGEDGARFRRTFSLGTRRSR